MYLLNTTSCRVSCTPKQRPNQLRFPVFAHNANPAIDQPIVHKSLAYIQEQVTAGNLIRLEDGSAQALPPREKTDQRRLKSSMNDWHIADSQGYSVWQLRTEHASPGEQSK